MEEANRWLRSCEEFVKGLGEDKLPMDYLTAQIDLALIGGDAPRARFFLETMMRNGARFEPGRLRNDVLLYRLRTEQMCSGTAVQEEDLAELLRFHGIARRFGRHDNHMDVLWVALTSVDRSDEASQLLAEYLSKHRRERRSCGYFLRTRTFSDPVWRSLAAQSSTYSYEEPNARPTTKSGSHGAAEQDDRR
jgi:hypothetical protein